MKTAFTNKLEGGVTSLPDRIDINGYYRYWNRSEWGGYKSIPGSKDTLFVDVMFYPDGTFIYNLYKQNGYLSYNDYFSEIIRKGRSDWFYFSHGWGVYSVVADTIKAQFLLHAAHFSPWWGGQEWFLIKDRSTLQLIFSDGLFDVTERSRELGEIDVKTASDVIFHPLEVIPPSYAWFKENKFFWRSERDWRNYMEFIKEK
ncbi:MAG: hypothetical protein IT249_00655 [Chitinophagaceae bacterium]|nr:hypothetical protein [Chitinophagaceae bacterium]